MDFIPNFDSKGTLTSYVSNLRDHNKNDKVAVTRNGGKIVRLHWIIAIVAKAFACLFQISFKEEHLMPALSKFRECSNPGAHLIGKGLGSGKETPEIRKMRAQAIHFSQAQAEAIRILNNHR